MPDLMREAPCGFVTFDDSGTMVEVNDTLATMLDYSRVELLGWHFEKILPPGGRIFYHTYLFPMLKVQNRVDEVYLTLRTRHGADIPMLLNGARTERDGKLVNDCVCVRMIQRHAYEDQLLQARRLAEESNAAKAKFLSMMSHDLRSPLTTIRGNALMLAGEVFGPLTNEQRLALSTIVDACGMQMTLIGDILDYARLDSGQVKVEPRAVPVRGAIGRAEALMRVQADDAGLKLTVDACRDDTVVLADPDRLQQVLLNLLTNAIKFTPTGGAITMSCADAGERVLIRVSDTGIGISPDDLQEIFSPFVQLGNTPGPASKRGVGLGLAISRELARAMSGDVTAESAPGSGSIFTVDLPRGS